jgi:hypothetical protein
MKCYVGLDVHSKASVFVIQDGSGCVVAQGEVPPTPEGFRGWSAAERLPAGRGATSTLEFIDRATRPTPRPPQRLAVGPLIVPSWSVGVSGLPNLRRTSRSASATAGLGFCSSEAL